MNKPIHVNSEIGQLKKVMLHRPGKELNNLIPDHLERLLFDDIPFLEEAQREHDAFAKILSENGVEVLYLEKLVAEAIDHANVKNAFVAEWLTEADIPNKTIEDRIRDYMLQMADTLEMVLKSMEGFKQTEIAVDDMLAEASETPFLVDPMPNLYFTRDPFATMGNGVSLNHMYSATRNRETIYGKYIFEYHPVYGGDNVPLYYDRHETTRIEGGDELVLSKDTLAIGISQRTDAQSVKKLAKQIFAQTDFSRVLGFEISSNRKFMHLDTVFTMIDYDKFTIHPEIEADLRIHVMTEGENGQVNTKLSEDRLEVVLAKALKVDQVTLIRTGGDDIVAAAREQWNDGSNTLAIAPGVVIVYDRNTVTNQKLEEAGITLHKLRGSELVRGRGGPRCMSMPFYREDLPEK